MQNVNGPVRIGLAGPVGAGKTSIVEALCKAMRDEFEIAVITNDIYTKEDGEYLMRAQALPLERIRAVETGGCPHTAIREDPSINLAAVSELTEKFPNLDMIFIESGGDNLTAMFSPELADYTIFVVDVAMGQDIPRKRGPGITKSDILVINKTDLAPYVNVDMERYRADIKIARPEKSTVFFSNQKADTTNTLVETIKALI